MINGANTIESTTHQNVTANEIFSNALHEAIELYRKNKDNTEFADYIPHELLFEKNTSFSTQPTVDSSQLIEEYRKKMAEELSNNKKMIEYHINKALSLLKQGEVTLEKLTYKDLHYATEIGNIELLNLLLSKNVNVNMVNEFGENALSFAQNKETIDCLIRYGIEKFPYADVLMAMREHDRRELYGYFKTIIGYDKKAIQEFESLVTALLKMELENAKKQGKNLLIVLGEMHDDYRTYKAEKIILKVASGLGINMLYDERSQKAVAKHKMHYKCYKQPLSYNHSALLITKFSRKYNYSVEGVDNYPGKCTPENNFLKRERNIFMKRTILTKDKDATLIIGGDHMQGLLNEKDSSLIEDSPRKYRVIPFNLAKIKVDKYSQLSEKMKLNSTETSFLYDPKNAIQVSSSLSFSLLEAEKVIKHWNDDDFNIASEIKENDELAKELPEIQHLSKKPRLNIEKEFSNQGENMQNPAQISKSNIDLNRMEIENTLPLLESDRVKLIV